MLSTQSPYVVTDDLELVFSHVDGITPDVNNIDQASTGVIQSLETIFPKVERIPAARISGYLEDRVLRSSLPVVSLAGLLAPSDRVISLEFSRSARLVSTSDGYEFEDVGLLPRFQDKKCIDGQIEDAVARIRACGVSAVDLADDVVFSGGTVLDIVQRLAAYNIAVKNILASVSLQKAVHRLGEQNISVISDFVYEEVVDEVCMRDFIVGAPGGGLNIVREDGSYAAAPYINPFGRVESWASIGSKNASPHSKACLVSALQLWDEIDAANGATICFNRLPKPVLFCNDNEGIAARIRDCLDRGRYAARTYSL